jgi:hypothetical protein
VCATKSATKFRARSGFTLTDDALAIAAIGHKGGATCDSKISRNVMGNTALLIQNAILIMSGRILSEKRI